YEREYAEDQDEWAGDRQSYADDHLQQDVTDHDQDEYGHDRTSKRTSCGVALRRLIHVYSLPDIGARPGTMGRAAGQARKPCPAAVGGTPITARRGLATRLGPVRHPWLRCPWHVPRALRRGTIQAVGASDACEAVAPDADPLPWNVRGVLGQQQKPPRGSGHCIRDRPVHGQHIGAPRAACVWPLVQNVGAACALSAEIGDGRDDSPDSDVQLLVNEARDLAAVGTALGLAHDVAHDRADRLGVAALHTLGGVRVGGESGGYDGGEVIPAVERGESFGLDDGKGVPPLRHQAIEYLSRRADADPLGGDQPAQGRESNGGDTRKTGIPTPPLAVPQARGQVAGDPVRKRLGLRRGIDLGGEALLEIVAQLST